MHLFVIKFCFCLNEKEQLLKSYYLVFLTFVSMYLTKKFVSLSSLAKTTSTALFLKFTNLTYNTLNNSNTHKMSFNWSEGHPPSSVPVVFQIVILHLLALFCAVFFFFLRRYLIYLRNQRLEGSKTLYTVRRNKTSSNMIWEYCWLFW